MSNQTRDGGSTGMVRAQDLLQKHPQRDQGRVDAILSRSLNCIQCWRDGFLRKDVRKPQLAFLQKLTSEKSELLP